MSPNLALLQQRVGEIRLNLARLRKAAELPRSEFMADDNLVDASLYRLLTTIEAAQAICIHVAARIPTRAPDSGPDCFAALAGSGVIDTALGERLCGMARFRNLLVHRYWELDLARVHAILREDLGDLEQYIEQLATYLGGRL